ncbi:unnamed protein product [Peniophora sp. CBMAI 1063]|nr:unnamed protein product [Peniophora sp. CBMAI 1063]
MEILSYIPAALNFLDRVHVDPFKLLDSEDEGTDSEDNDEKDSSEPGWYTMGLAQSCHDYGNCLAELRFRNGCARFCSSRPWNCFDVLRVCKHWRATAYSWPQFWTNIAIQNYDTVMRSLKLSGTLPITIHSSNPSHGEMRKSPSTEALNAALSELHRVRVLDISFFSFSDSNWGEWTRPIISHLRRLPASQLVTLRLKLERSSSDEPVKVKTVNWTEQMFPRLHTLELHSAKLYAPCALIAPTLSELTLTDCEAPWNSAADFLRALSLLPQLQILSITRMDNPRDFDDHRLKQPGDLRLPIVMAHLRSIELSGSFRFVNRVLSVVKFPLDSTTLKLYYEYDAHGVDLGHDSDSALEAARNMFAEYALAMPPRSFFDSVDLDFDLDERVIGITLTQPDPSNITVSLRHSWHEDHDHHAGDILSFIRQTSSPLFSTERMTSLAILSTGYFDTITQHSPTFTPDACYDWVAGLSALRFIRLSSQAVTTFIAWMVHRLNTAAGLSDSGDDVAEDESDSENDNVKRSYHRSRYLSLLDMPKPRRRIRPTIIFPALRCLLLNECDLQGSAGENEAGEDDLLFTYLWLYLHAQTPKLVLVDTELTHRMLRELRRMLGPSRFEERSVWPVSDEPYIEVSRSWARKGEEELRIHDKSWTKIIKLPRWGLLPDSEVDDESKGS